MKQIFSFSKIAENAKKHPCPRCGGPSIEVYFVVEPIGPTGIFRCLADDCDTMSDPTMPEVHP